MAQFRYVARDRTGKQIQGVLAAGTIQELREQLRKKDLFVTQIREQGEAGTGKAASARGARRKIKLFDMVVMSRQFATLIGAGLPLVECLSSLATQTENQRLAEVLKQVRMDVLSGSTLTEALGRHMRVFNELYRSLVSAGETAGKLEEMLEIAAFQFEREAELREKVRSAMLYPTLVLITAVGVVVFMLIFVVPVFAKVYDQFHAELPFVTRLLVLLSMGVMRFWYLGIAAAAGCFYALRRYTETEKGRWQYDRLKLKMPLLGKLNRKIAIARLIRTLGAMVKAGVPIFRGLSVAAQTSGNVIIGKALMGVATSVQEGMRISVPMDECGEFPTMVSRMVAAGEESGNLDEMLEKLAIFYERDIEYSVERLTRVLEPLMTIVIGGVVLFVLLALYMPIFNLSNVIHK